MGFFVTLEGIDSSGKNTQSSLLAEYYAQLGKDVVKFDLPAYETITGEMINGYLKGDWKIDVSEGALLRLYDKKPLYLSDPSSYAFQCCQIVNRLESLPDTLWDADSSSFFIADRYNTSALAYGSAFGLDVDWLIKIHKHLPKPNVSIFLDIPVEASFKRRPERRDDYEKNFGLLSTVRNKYVEIFNSMGDDYIIIDAFDSKEKVFQRILEQVEKSYNRFFHEGLGA